MLDRPTAADYLPVPPKGAKDAQQVCARGDNRPPSREQAFDVLAEWARKHAGVPWCSVNWPFVVSKWQQAIGQPVTGQVDGDFTVRLRAEVAAAQRKLDGTLVATQTGVTFGLETLTASSAQNATSAALPAELCWSSGQTIRCARDANCAAVLTDAYRASGEPKDGYDAELLACQRVAKFRGETTSSFRFGAANPQSAVLRYAGGRLGELRLVAHGGAQQVVDELTRRYGAPRVDQLSYTRDVVVGSEDRVVPGYVQYGVVYPPYITTVAVYGKQPYTMPKRLWSAGGVQAEEILDDVGNPTSEFMLRFGTP